MAYGYVRNNTYYKTCTDCGANLDPIERCDCEMKQYLKDSSHEHLGASSSGKNLLVEYQRSLAKNKMAPKTIETYLRAVSRANDYLQENAELSISSEEGVKQVTEAHLQQYYESLVAENKKRSTRNLFVSSLRAFFDYCVKRKIRTDNPAHTLPHAKARYGDVDTKLDEEQFYTMDAVREVLENIGKMPNKAKKRDVALFALLCASAMRINEACSLNIKDMASIRKGYVYVIGKGGRREKVNVASFAVPYLERYLRVRNTDDGKAPLFLSQKNRRMTENAAWKAFARFQKPLELSTGTHICRHTALTHIAHKAGIVVARDAGRHKQTSTTNRYVHRLDDAVTNVANSTPIAEAFENAMSAAS